MKTDQTKPGVSMSTAVGWLHRCHSWEKHLTGHRALEHLLCPAYGRCGNGLLSFYTQASRRFRKRPS